MTSKRLLVGSLPVLVGTFVAAMVIGRSEHGGSASPLEAVLLPAVFVELFAIVSVATFSWLYRMNVNTAGMPPLTYMLPRRAARLFAPVIGSGIVEVVPGGADAAGLRSLRSRWDR